MISTKEQEKTIEKWLKNYNSIKASIESLYEQYIDIAEEGVGVDISREPTGKTNKFNSAIENAVIKVDKLEISKRIDNAKVLIKSLDKAFKTLTDIEKEVIEKRFMQGLYYYQFCYSVGCSERTAKRLKIKAIEKIRICIFGQE